MSARVGVHPGGGEHGLQLAEERFAQAGRNTCGRTLHDASEGIAIGAGLQYEALHERGVVGTAYFGHAGADGDAGCSDELPGDGACGYNYSREPRAGAASATVVAYAAVFQMVCSVGMARAHDVAHGVVVGAAGIGVGYGEGNRGAGGYSVEKAGEHGERVGLATRGGACGSRAGATPTNGIPSSTPPMAGPWLSPKEVSRRMCPNVFILQGRLRWRLRTI